ncbi:lasso peptide biosynthesis B2 protein [Streptomyces sp. 8N706]|uniref:lasso peptide biosynthesis B2 protein n=1 Tax=Streptomyces sp. 8N706 TaxID=3457416 RepID=UPI003FCF0AFD
MTVRIRIPEHVHASDAPHGGTVLLNARSGQWYAMNRTARALWDEWHRTGDFDMAVHSVTSRFPQAGEERVRADAERLADDLVERGLVTVERSPGGEERDLGAVERGLVALDDPAVEGGRSGRGARKGPNRRKEERSDAAEAGTSSAPGWRHRTAGAIGLGVALCLLHLPFRLTLRVLPVLKRRWCRRTATARQAHSVFEAVLHAGRRYPGRVACLEHSLGAVLGLALAGLSADWCIGSADDPYRFHAWLETGGRPVTSADDTERGPFRRVLAV